MVRSRVTPLQRAKSARRGPLVGTLLIALLLAPAAVLVVACSRPPEQQLLTQFFRAARARDNTTLGMMSAVSFNPAERGIVTDFDIASVSAEQRSPLNLKVFVDAQRKARDAEAEFSKRKKEYQDANLQMIEQVLKLERDPKAKMTPAQVKVKAEWDKWREETGTVAKASASARAALASATGPAEASLTQPGRPPLDPEKFEGELLTKAVTLNADVQAPNNGPTSQKTLVITMQRVVGKLGGEEREGRWVITQITGA
jgi:hypothetical protein